MPTGPKGQKRPADVIGNAIKVARIATGEETDDCDNIYCVRKRAGWREWNHFRDFRVDADADQAAASEGL